VDAIKIQQIREDFFAGMTEHDALHARAAGRDNFVFREVQTRLELQLRFTRG